MKSSVDLSELIHAQGFTSIENFLKSSAKLSLATYRNAIKGQKITAESAGKLASALKLDIKTLFTLETDNRPLSAKTIREHHVLIHMILHQAEQELLIPLTNRKQKALYAG